MTRQEMQKVIATYRIRSYYVIENDDGSFAQLAKIASEVGEAVDAIQHAFTITPITKRNLAAVACRDSLLTNGNGAAYRRWSDGRNYCYDL